MMEWQTLARGSARYVVLGGMLGVVGSTLVLSHLVPNATVIGFVLALASIPLLFAAYRTLPGIRK
jgi:hypothetical protein